MATTARHSIASPAAAAHRPRRLPAALHHLTLALALASAALLLVQPAPCLAADPAALAAALTQFDQASNGQESAIEPAAQQLRALSAAEPADPLLRAYAGSATTMLARTTLLPWKKMSQAEDGLAMLDKALAQLTPAHDAPAHRNVPTSLEVRFTAASTFLALPSMFNRGERGARLLDEVLKSPLFEPAPAPFKAAVWLRAGSTAAKAQRTDEARQLLTKAAAVTGSPAAAAAAAQLKAL